MTLQNDIPVVVIGGKLGGLSICRTLGKLNIDIHVFDEDPKCPAFLSKYCRVKNQLAYEQEKDDDYRNALVAYGKRLGNRPVLIPTSDELAMFVSKHASGLIEFFRFPENEYELVNSLASKRTMFDVAKANGIPTASAFFPENIEDVVEYAQKAEFPVMLKGVFGNRLQADSGKKMVIINNPTELVSESKKLSAYGFDNLMIQEYIPGDDDQVYIFNGYFNQNSDCLIGFTGRKIRQFPIHTGCASLGECCKNDDVYQLTIDFMKSLKYRGVLDIGYRYDHRDGKYKVLDINPRVGQAFRLFVDSDDADVVKALYLDMSGQKVRPGAPHYGRRWIIEDYDLISTFHYFREGSLNASEWFNSFRNLKEGIWFDYKDLRPFSYMMTNLSKRAALFLVKQVFKNHYPMNP